MFYGRLIVLLYADDTVILANSAEDLQNSMNTFNTYCKTWKLSVNIAKTKVVIFGARKTDSFEFTIGDQLVAITEAYKYLGIHFSQTGSFLKARKHIAEQAKKAMYLLFNRINNLNLPIDLQIKLFDHTVLPILTYECEVIGYENICIFENIHTVFLENYKKQKEHSFVHAVCRIR